MQIRVVKKLDRSSKEFVKKQWIIADKKHYGKAVNWDEHKAYFLKALEIDRLVGVLDLYIAHGVANIKDIIVDHKFQRLGIGKKLMLEAEKIARKAGAHKMFLDTGIDWDAKKFYSSLGYKKACIVRDHYFRKDFIYFSKKLR